MKSFFRILLLSLVLVMVALISALTSMRFAIHGRQVEVPKLVGLTPEEAVRSAEEQGLALKVDLDDFEECLVYRRGTDYTLSLIHI